MSSKTFFVDIEANVITLPDSRWYETRYGTFPSATTVLNMVAKPGLEAWKTKLAMDGIDPKTVGRQAMDEGSEVHTLCENWMKGATPSFFSDEGEKQYKLHEEWIPFCRFMESYKELEIAPILIEQELVNGAVGYAGTLDMLCILTPKKEKPRLALVDLKRAKAPMPSYYWQVASYVKAIQWLYNNELDFREYLQGFDINDDQMNGLSGYLLLLNVETKKGWRLTEVKDIKHSYKNFLACYRLFKDGKKSFEYAKEEYLLTAPSVNGEELTNEDEL